MTIDAGSTSSGRGGFSGRRFAGDDLRIDDTALRPLDPIAFSFDGDILPAYRGESIAAALAASHRVASGQRRDGTPRGGFCGMGVCQECLVDVDGRPSVRACMTPVLDGMKVASQQYAVHATVQARDATRADVHRQRIPLLVVGAGPAGLSAACAAAACGVDTIVLDERSDAGGQYYKQVSKSHAVVNARALDAQFRAGRDLIERTEALGAAIWRDATVWGAFGVDEIAVAARGAQHLVAPDRMVLATGVYERGVPIPGWTLPGCMTTGAAQTLLRAYRVSPGRRVVIAGNGPLDFQLAADLTAAGVEVVALVEAATQPGMAGVAGFARAAMLSPRLIASGLGYVARLKAARVRIHYASAVVAVEGRDRVESCTIARIGADGAPLAGTQSRIAADCVCLGYGFLPSNEIARALGCRHSVDQASDAMTALVDDDGLSTVPNVYIVGDAAAMRGAQVARCRGFIAGCAVARSLGHALPDSVARQLQRAKRQLRRHLAFQRVLWRLFAAPRLTTQLAQADTIVCRCESVSLDTIESAIRDGAASLGAVKRRTRAGMGRCQGRYCESIVRALLPADRAGERDDTFALAPRAPIKPVAIGELL